MSLLSKDVGGSSDNKVVELGSDRLLQSEKLTNISAHLSINQ
jgi:hypothetical protein